MTYPHSSRERSTLCSAVLGGAVSRAETCTTTSSIYLSKGAPVNRLHLRQRLIDSGFITDDVDCTLAEIKKMLCDRFDSIDFEQAKRDVEPFIRDTSVLDIWSADFFTQITMNLTEC